MKEMDEQTSGLIDLFDYVDDLKVFPVAGGALDQSASFMAALKFWRNELATWRAEKSKGKRNG